MDVKQDQAFKRLLKKLSALRATLNNDERILLDGLVISSADEVTSHSLRVTPISPSAKPSKTPAASEVAAHSMKTSSASPSAKPSKTPAASEVAAHSMKTSSASPSAKPSKTPAASEVAAHSMKTERPILERPTPRVQYDPVKEEYQRIP